MRSDKFVFYYTRLKRSSIKRRFLPKIVDEIKKTNPTFQREKWGFLELKSIACQGGLL